MRTCDFDYRLPSSAIAQFPSARGESRLLDLSAASRRRHRIVGELPELLRADDLVVVNNTRVLAARLRARRPTGGRVEILLVRQRNATTWEALLRPGRRLAVGSELHVGAELRAHILAAESGRYQIELDPPLDMSQLERIGEVPLPPYIERPVEPADRERYQTLYASRLGAVAAPTAGLHLSAGMLERMERRGIERVELTLHVGPGTFRPVKVEEPSLHHMESERYAISPGAAASLNAAREQGRRIVAVGTTVVRALEAAARRCGPRLRAVSAETDLFITPGYGFQVVDLLLTNFHLPRSTLLMLVCAFAGSRRILDAYDEALREGYRFYSYGDAMLVERARAG